MTTSGDGEAEVTTEPAAARADIRQLTGVRFIAAIWVVLYHFQLIIFGLVPELHPVGFLFNAGYLAVDLFFALSGYIIAYQYLGAFPGGRGPYGRFLVKRLARIYPLQFVTLLLAIATIVVGAAIGIHIPDGSSFTVWGAVQDALLIRGWEPFPSQGWNFPAWSLSAEWFAYLLFPAVALLIGIVRKRRATLIATLAVCLGVEALGAWLLPSFNGMPHPLVRVMAAFVAGAAVHAAGPIRVRGGLLTGLGLVALAGLIAIDGFVQLDAVRAPVALALSVLVVAGLANGSGRLIDWLGSRPLEYGGRISYGIYMIHGILLMIAGALLALLMQHVPHDVWLQWPTILRVGILLVPLAAVVLLGAALYHLVERPAQRWISRRGPSSSPSRSPREKRRAAA
jgi:peptidoglycan/LPS O-acetylase OafA/YrhL